MCDKGAIHLVGYNMVLQRGADWNSGLFKAKYPHFQGPITMTKTLTILNYLSI